MIAHYDIELSEGMTNVYLRKELIYTFSGDHLGVMNAIRWAYQHADQHSIDARVNVAEEAADLISP